VAVGLCDVASGSASPRVTDW